MVTTYIPYADEADALNLGLTYNRLMEASPTQWVCFLDHDAMWLTKDWHRDLVEATSHAHAEGIGMMSCRTNRIGTSAQRLKGQQNNHDIAKLRRVAKNVRDSFEGDLERAIDTDVIYLSGVMLLVDRNAWHEMGGFAPGFLGVDYDACVRMRRAGYKVGLMRHVVVYHWWRGDGDMSHVHEANELHANPAM